MGRDGIHLRRLLPLEHLAVPTNRNVLGIFHTAPTWSLKYERFILRDWTVFEEEITPPKPPAPSSCEWPVSYFWFIANNSCSFYKLAIWSEIHIFSSSSNCLKGYGLGSVEINSLICFVICGSCELCLASLWYCSTDSEKLLRITTVWVAMHCIAL